MRDHSKEHSILLDGSVEVRETQFTDGVKYTISKPEDGDLTGSVTVTSSATYTGYENAPPDTSTSETTDIDFADVAGEMEGAEDPGRSPESILEEYQDRAEQVARLEAARDAETNPDLRDYYQLQIDTHNNILNDLTTEALDAGIPQSQLDQIDTQAQTTAANNPISQQTLNTLFFDGTWFDGGTFGSTLAGEVESIGVGFAAMFTDLIGNDALAAQQYQWAYENGPLGLTADSDGFYYYGTRGMLAVAGAAASSAFLVGVAEVAFFGNSSFMVDGISSAGRIIQIRHPTSGIPLIRLDYHAFAEGGRKLLHVDSNFFGIKHFPWP